MLGRPRRGKDCQKKGQRNTDAGARGDSKDHQPCMTDWMDAAKEPTQRNTDALHLTHRCRCKAI